MRTTRSSIFALMSFFTVFLVTTVLMPVLAVADLNVPCQPAQQTEIQTEHPHQQHQLHSNALSDSASGLMLADAINPKTPDNGAKYSVEHSGSVHDCCDEPTETKPLNCCGHNCADHNGCDCPKSTTTSLYLSGMSWTLQTATAQSTPSTPLQTETSEYVASLYRPPKFC